MVMATGIVSISAQLRGMPTVAAALLWVNIAFYALLWLLTILRLVYYFDRFLADLLDHGRCVGFFTLVAATCVLGNQFVVVTNRPQLAIALWLAGIVLWVTVTYTVFTILTVKSKKPSLSEGLNGG